MIGFAHLSKSYKIFALLIPSVCIGSSLLTQTARDVLAHSHDRARAEVFLQQAILENGDDPEPLALLAALKSADLKDDLAELRTQVEPMLTRLLALREQNSATKPSDLALALELNALFLEHLDRKAEAQPMQVRSLLIRKQLVREMRGQETGLLEPSKGFAGVGIPTVLVKTDPEYTDDARLSKISGTVLISTVIDPEGLPRQIELVRGIGFGLDEKAAQTVAAWRFRPGTKDGQPVPVKATIEVNFRLL